MDHMLENVQVARVRSARNAFVSVIYATKLFVSRIVHVTANSVKNMFVRIVSESVRVDAGAKMMYVARTV